MEGGGWKESEGRVLQDTNQNTSCLSVGIRCTAGGSNAVSYALKASENRLKRIKASPNWDERKGNEKCREDK